MRAVVIFSDGDHPPKWWHRLLAAGFKHTEVFLETEHGRWTGVAGGCGDLFVLSMPEGFDPLAFAASARVRAVEATAAPRNGGWRLLGRRDCTAVVKAAIGLRDWRVMSPKHLFDHLTREAS